MKKDRKVVFWAWRKRPSSIMRGIQVAEELSRRGFETEVRFGPSRIALRDIRDGIIVCVKSSPRFSGWLKARQNRIVYDAIDFTAFRGVPKNADALIAGSEYMNARLKEQINSNVVVKTIYHHADPNLKPHKAGEKILHLAYVGEKEESSFVTGEIPELNVVSFKKNSDWREEIRNYNAHFSARVDPQKSVIKLANVAALGAVYLTGTEPGCVELLGSDYPFFLRDPNNLEKVREDVKKLKDAVGTPLWKSAQERIQKIRPRLTLQTTAQAYEELFADIG